MRKCTIFLALLMLTMLTGCSSFSKYLESKMISKSGINEDAAYQTYQTYSDQGILDQNGFYSDNAMVAEGDDINLSECAVLSFSDNAYMNVRYFKDAEHSEEISGSTVYLTEGETLFASVVLNKDVSSSTYKFDVFRLSEIDSEGNRVELGYLNPGDDGLLLTLTGQYLGKELALDPLGTYTTRQITLWDSYIDNNEREHALSGKWIVNDKPINGHVAEINPISSYIISYEFDGDEYFYLSSDPQCYYSNNEDGVIIFNKLESTAETVNYSVQLHQYVAVDLISSLPRTVSINSGSQQSIKAGQELHISRLKYGDVVVLVTDRTWDELETNRDLILQSSEELHQDEQIKYRYTLFVPDKGNEFMFIPDEYSYAHGTIRFRCFGEDVTTTQYLVSGSRIYYEQEFADEGYWLADGDHVIVVTTPEETRKKLNNIHFSKKVQVRVQLEQPQYGGKIEYYVNGTQISDTEYKGYIGDEITMKFFPWEGWMNNYNNGAKYVVTSLPSQSVEMNKKNVAATAFTESADHKPVLNVVLDQSVGNEMVFRFEASGLTSQDYQYSGAKTSKDGAESIISKEIIGTEKGITFSMRNRAIQTGTAVKVVVEKSGEDKSGNKTQTINRTFYRLITSLTDVQAPINIYDSSELGTSNIWYKSVKITVSVVDVKKFANPQSPENATLTVKKTSSLELLHDGDIIEDSEMVTVSFIPDEGYFIGGAFNGDGFETSMTFDKYLTEITNLVKEHPIKKYIQVTLDSDDPYGTCSFKCEGTAVDGTITVKEGEIITLDYRITNPSYSIPSSIKKPVTKAIKTMTISLTDDGTVLSRESFGITVQEVN